MDYYAERVFIHSHALYSNCFFFVVLLLCIRIPDVVLCVVPFFRSLSFPFLDQMTDDGANKHNKPLECVAHDIRGTPLSFHESTEQQTEVNVKVKTHQ